jgi:N-methylhydantoinase B
VQGEWGDAWTGGISSGLTDGGDFYVWFNMDGGGMGTGAQRVCDGHDAAGLMCQVGNMLPDVEMNEMLYPALYLHKRLALSSCGHGASRGGFGLDYAWTLWNAQECVQTVFSPTAQLPPWGFAGGLPAGGSGHVVLRDTDVNDVLGAGRYATVEDLAVGERDVLDINAQGLAFGPADVFVQWIGGGGGLGDPLLRAPELVAQDVHDGYVTHAAATEVYGVAVEADGSGLDLKATDTLRQAVRTRRLGAEPAREARALQLDDDDLVPVRPAGGTWSCPACDGPLGDGDDWRPSAVRARAPLAERQEELGVRVRERELAPAPMLDELCCPCCGTLLHAQVTVAEAGA